MSLIEIAAKAYTKQKVKYVRAFLDAVVSGTDLNEKDRSRPIWYWALKRWGDKKWPAAEYEERTRYDQKSWRERA